jgi:hypothetical protein
MAVVGQSKATGVTQHVGVSFEAKLGSLSSAFRHPGKAGCRE